MKKAAFRWSHNLDKNVDIKDDFFLGTTEYSEQIAQALISVRNKLSNNTEI